MSNNRRLLVPMYMEALLLRNDKTDCLNLSPNLSNFTQSILGDVLQPTALQNATNTYTLERGIHLHWTLPKALKHSFLDEGTEMNFPFVPNRWMVIRIQTNNGIKNMPSRIWVVESDRNNAGLNTRNLVLVTDNKLDFKNIGKAFDYPYNSDNTSLPVLTGVSAANPFFASFYPGCRNIFGFYDDLKDITGDCSLTYMVTGWYSDPAADPLAPLDFSGDPQTLKQKKRKRELDWFKQQWIYAQGDYPTSCLLHSSIHSVLWNNKSPDNGIPEGPVSVFAGNTSIEALSAQIRNSLLDSRPDVEELLNALQYQFLDDDRNPPGRAAIKDEIHKRGFNTRNGGIMWEVNRVEASDEEVEDTKKKRSHFPADPGILPDLKKLNDLQGQLNITSRETLSLQQEYYFLWYKQAQKTVSTLKNTIVPGFDFDNSRKAVNAQIQNNFSRITLLNQQITDLRNTLNHYAELGGATPEFELKEKQDDRFWEANEPVVLLCGSGIGNTDKPNLQAGDRELVCRTIDQLVVELELDVPSIPDKIAVKIPASEFIIPRVNSLTAGNVPADEIRALTNEAILFDDAFSVDIAMLAYNFAKLGQGKDNTSSVVIAFADEVILKQQKILNKEINASSGNASILAPPGISINKWLQAWSPLFMHWGVKFYPCYQDITNLDLLKDANWQLEDNLFFKNKFANTSSKTPAIPFFNISPFSAAVYSNLKRVLPENIVGKYGKLNLIAQSLSGLHKMLLMQKPGVQLPPLVYDIPKRVNFRTDYIIDQAELNVIGSDGYRLGSFPGDIKGTLAIPFSPLRSGFLEIISLSIVDAFGQVRQVIIENAAKNPMVISPGNMKGLNTSPGNLIPLAPRFLQASRLHFQWLNARDEIVYQDAGNTDSPVFGWVVPNFLDNSLMVYDGLGNEVAILQLTNDISKDKGINLKIKPFPGSEAITDLSANPQLKKFMDNIGTGPIASGLIDLALQINLNITGTNAMQNNTSSLLCGQPMALARCSVQLELFGKPALNQRWDQSGKQNTGGIETVKIPLYLGDFNKDKDGLIGYFSDADPGSFLNTTNNAPEFRYSKTEPFFKSNTPVKLCVKQGAVKLTLLIDPSAGVHISSGVLPTKFVELFPQNSQDLLASLNTVFMVAPFIAEKVDPGIPIPTSINGNWKWTHRSDVATWEKDTDVAVGKTKQLAVFKKQQVYEGWLRLNNLKTNS